MLANTCNEGKSLKVQVLTTIFRFFYYDNIKKRQKQSYLSKWK